jgi:hypothetical protein
MAHWYFKYRNKFWLLIGTLNAQSTCNCIAILRSWAAYANGSSSFTFQNKDTSRAIRFNINLPCGPAI